jgi:hypothetical protein
MRAGNAKLAARVDKRTLTADEAYEISFGDVLFATPLALLYAEISINLIYPPWVLPFHLNKPQGNRGA